jgi:tripartite ATP-independent transporter DctP family solute receptor
MSTRPPSPSTPNRSGPPTRFKKRTNGRYEITVYPASQLGKETDINQGLTLGTVDIIISGSSFAARAYPPIGVTYYPFTFRGPDHLLAYTKSDVYAEMVKGYQEKSGHQIVAVSYYGTRHTTSNKPIKSCADMKGLKIRVPDVPAYLAMPRACGANTAPIAFAEVYLALQNGTVEAQENPLTTIEAKKFYEVQKNIILTGHIVDHLNTVVAKQLWDKLSPEDRKIFTRGRAGGGRAHHQEDPGRRDQAGPVLQGQGPCGHRDRQGRLPRQRAEERHLRAVRLPQGRLGPHPGDQVSGSIIVVFSGGSQSRPGADAMT